MLSNNQAEHGNSPKSKSGRMALATWLLAGAASIGFILCGCRSPEAKYTDLLAITNSAASVKTEGVILREGDTVRITFPGAPNLNTTQVIRRDGKVSLPLIGEFKAAGLSPADMQKELIRRYEPELQTKEVNVVLESSAFAVYVTGAVLRPGKLMSDRPLTALQAIIEAGCDYTKANLKSVQVIRQENGRTERHTLNLKRELKGEGNESFQLKPADIVYVPERFSWF